MAEMRFRRRKIRDVELAGTHAVQEADEPRGLVERIALVVALGRVDSFRKRASIERRLRPPHFEARTLRRRRESRARERFEALLHVAALGGREIAQRDVHLATSSNKVTRPFFSPTARRLPSGDQRVALISESSICTSIGCGVLPGRHNVRRQSRPPLTKCSPPVCQAKVSTRSVWPFSTMGFVPSGPRPVKSQSTTSFPVHEAR